MDFLQKKHKKNEGEVPQYYVERNHEAIIDPAVFDSVQVLMQTMEGGKDRNSSVSIFSSKIKCGDCGGWYGSKVWHSTDKYRKVIWQCNHKFDGEEKCSTPHLDEEQIKQIFIKALNMLSKEKSLIISGFEDIRDTAFSTAELEAKAKGLSDEMNVVAELMEKAVYENDRTAQGQDDYQRRYEELVEREGKAKSEYDDKNPSPVCRRRSR